MPGHVDFSDYFWGEKYEGFNVLYSNMKFSINATKEFGDYFRERARMEEENAKNMIKIVKQLNAVGNCGSFGPLLSLLRNKAEKLGSIHSVCAGKLFDLLKDVSKFGNDLHKIHKQVKEDEAGTIESIKQIVDVNATMLKARSQLNRLKSVVLTERSKGGGFGGALEKSELKFKRAVDDYRALIEKYCLVRDDFDVKMSAASKHFQDVETIYLVRMREIMMNYFYQIEYNDTEIVKVRHEFQVFLSEYSVDKLLEQFAVSMHTGLEKADRSKMEDKYIQDMSSMSIVDEHSLDVPGGPISDVSNASSTEKSSMGSLSGGKAYSSTSDLSGSYQVTKIGGGKLVSKQKQDGRLRTWSSRNPLPTGTKTNSLLNLFVPSSNTGTVVSLSISPPSPSSDSCILNSTHKNQEGQTCNYDDNILPAPEEVSLRDVESPTRLWTMTGFLKRTNRKTKSDKKRKSQTSLSVDCVSMASLEFVSPPIVTTSLDEKRRNSEDTVVVPSNTMVNARTSSYVDEEGFSVPIKSSGNPWDSEFSQTKNFYSSDSDSEDERKQKIRIEIKPVCDTSKLVSEASISASVDELRSAVEAIELSAIAPKFRCKSALENRIYSKTELIKPVVNSGVIADDEIGGKSRQIHRSQSYSQLVGSETTPTTASSSNRSASQDLLGFSPFASPRVINNNNHGELDPKLKDDEEFISTTEKSSDTWWNKQFQPNTFEQSNTSACTTNKEVRDILNYNNSAGPAFPIKQNSVKSRHEVSNSLIALPRPPSRHSTSSGGLRIRSSPSPLPKSGAGSNHTITGQKSCDIPLAVAFQEVCHVYFRGTNESRCLTRFVGDMMISFPSGIHLSHMAPLQFRIMNSSAVLESVYPNQELVETSSSVSLGMVDPIYEFKMDALKNLLEKQTEQNPNASYFNIDILKYQIRCKPGVVSCPLQMVSYWKCTDGHTDLRLDYKYNTRAIVNGGQSGLFPLANLTIAVPVSGGVINMQSQPNGQWHADIGRAIWKLHQLSPESGGVGCLRARFELSDGPGTEAPIAAQFNCEGNTLSGVDFELVGCGYRISLIKKRFVSGKYQCEKDSKISTENSSMPLASRYDAVK